MHRLRGTRSDVQSVADGHESLPFGESVSRERALLTLVERSGLAGRVASIHLPPHQSRFAVMSVPDLDEEAEGWIEDEAYRLLGASLPRQSLVLRYMRLGSEEGGENDGGSSRVLVGCARREAVEACAELIRSAGLIPGGIYLDASIAGYAHVLDPTFVDGVSWVYSNGGVPVIARYRDGALCDATELLQGNPSVADLRVEMRGMGASADAAVVHVLGPHPEMADEVGGGMPIRFESEAYAEAMARAVAVTRWFSGLPRIDFLDSETKAEARVASEKRDALLFIRPTAIGVLSVLLLVFVAEVFVNARLAHVDAETRDLRPLIASLEAERIAVAELQNRRKDVGEALAGRSQLAGVLDAIGWGVPPSTRLTSLVLEREGFAGTGESWSARAIGESSDPQAVMGMLARMEADPALDGVTLRHTSRIEPQAPSADSRIRFEVSYRVQPSRFVLSSADLTADADANEEVESSSGGER
jgi:hypothetical protein